MGVVLVGGKRVRVIGRVSMSMIILDVTDVVATMPVNVLDEVVLIGTQQSATGSDTLTAIDVALQVQMSWYELLTRLNPLMKRIFF